MLSVAACSQPRPGTYDQVFTGAGEMTRSFKATLVIEDDDRFRYQMPMGSIAGSIRRSDDSLFFETGSADMRVVALRGRMVNDTLVLQQPALGGLGGLIGRDVATQRFVRR